jgi:hypothetical protein
MRFLEWSFPLEALLDLAENPASEEAGYSNQSSPSLMLPGNANLPAILLGGRSERRYQHTEKNAAPE